MLGSAKDSVAREHPAAAAASIAGAPMIMSSSCRMRPILNGPLEDRGRSGRTVI
jgi:hypothetical protein